MLNYLKVNAPPLKQKRAMWRRSLQSHPLLTRLGEMGQKSWKVSKPSGSSSNRTASSEWRLTKTHFRRELSCWQLGHGRHNWVSKLPCNCLSNLPELKWHSCAG